MWRRRRLCSRGEVVEDAASNVQKAGLSAGLVDNKIAALFPRLTSIRFVIPVARRKARG